MPAPIAETSCGRIEGIDRGRTLVFYGIPYAAPPVGARRWRPPQPPEPWTDVRPATERPTAAPQGDHPVQGFASSSPRSEDCLYLNVFTPALDGARRPVLFWIHGGGFTHGAGDEPLYNGSRLAERGDVVVVTINYRLGALGFLDLRSLLPESGVTANAGLLDQVAALRWVNENIEAFGGDPNNVVVFGESAGAASVGALLGMPAARGRFHRAVQQSGTGRAADPEDAARLARAVLGELGIPVDGAARIIEQPAEALVAAQSAVARRAQGEGLPSFGPVCDGDTVPRKPLDAVRAGAAAGISLLIGTNRDEVKLFAAVPGREPIDGERLVELVRGIFPPASGDDARGLIDTYRRSRAALGLPGSDIDIYDAIATDSRFRVPTMRFALAQKEHQPRTYVYLFTWESPARRGAFGSCHALEMPFVFGTLDAPTQDRFAGAGPEVERLSAQMMDAWIAFARTGDPAHEGIGAWPAYDDERRPTMVFGRDSGVADDPFSEERRAVERLLG